MATKAKANNKNTKTTEKKQVYKNPAESVVGKVIIWALVAAMALGGLATIIAVIISALQ